MEVLRYMGNRARGSYQPPSPSSPYPSSPSEYVSGSLPTRHDIASNAPPQGPGSFSATARVETPAAGPGRADEQMEARKLQISSGGERAKLSLHGRIHHDAAPEFGQPLLSFQGSPPIRCSHATPLFLRGSKVRADIYRPMP